MIERGAWRRIDMALAYLAAAIVAFGVLVLDWSVFVVIALFWFENVVIGVINVGKMLISGVRVGAAGSLLALLLAAFFTVHYGMFTVAHGVFIVMLFGQAELGGPAAGGLFDPLIRMLEYLVSDRDAWIAAAGVIALHAVAFTHWFGTARTQLAALPQLMFEPYGRIVVLHVTVIASGLLIGALKAPVAGALFLVALKLAFDITAAMAVAGPVLRRTLGRSVRRTDATPP